ncbi:MAG TPA: hypothetical protein V6C58_08055, partial [Allocoleopsis sp.]
MKNNKKILIFSAIVLSLTAYYYWQQFNYVPPVNSSSITQLSNNPENIANLPQKTAEIKQKINQVLPQQPAENPQKINQVLPQQP